MCRKVNCSNCNKATWAGCGMHVDAALQGVKEEDRCPNWKMGSSKPCGSQDGPMKGGFFSSLLGKSSSK
jgi:hypothetical protein